MATGVTPSLAASVNPSPAVGDIPPGSGKAPTGTIGAKLKGLWQSIRGKATPARMVVAAGTGDYRLQRKGQTGYERLQVIGKTMTRPIAGYAAPHAARVQVLPAQTGAQVAAAGPGAAPASLAALSDRILAPAYAQFVPLDASQRQQLADPAFALQHAKQVALRETTLLADLGELVRSAKLENESLRSQAGGQVPSTAAMAFKAVVAELLSLRLGEAGALFGKLAKGDSTDPAALRQVVYQQMAGGTSAAEPVTDAMLRDIAHLLGLASEPALTDAELGPMSPENRVLFRDLRRMEAEQEIGTALTGIVDAIGDSMLSLHDAGLLTPEVLRPLGAFQPLAAWATGVSASHQVQALTPLAGILEALAAGNPVTVDMLTGGDSRHDAIALKLKTIGMDEGPARDKTTVQHTLSAAKRQLALVWTEKEKTGFFSISRNTPVINPGGSDDVRINAALIRALQTGGAATKAGGAGGRWGAGIQHSAQAGKDVNLLIAQVMLLQKHVDAHDTGNSAEQRTERAQMALHAAVTALPAHLGSRIGIALTGQASGSAGMVGAIALALSEETTLAFAAQAITAKGSYDDAVLIKAHLESTDDKVSAAAAWLMGSETGVHGALIDAMKAVPKPTQAEQLDAVIAQRLQHADLARERFATALKTPGISAGDLDAMKPGLQAVHGLKAAQYAQAQVGQDSSLGLSKADFLQMGFTDAEAGNAMQDLRGEPGSSLEALLRQGLSSSADVKRVTDAVNNGIDRLFVKGQSQMTQATMDGISTAFPETQARKLLARVRDLAQPRAGQSGNAGSTEIFGAMFGEALGTADTPFSLLLKDSGDQVARTQARMARLVGELSALDTGADQAHATLAASANGTPPRRIDPASSAAKANATRLDAAAQTLDTLDHVVTAIVAARQGLDEVDALAAAVLDAAVKAVSDAGDDQALRAQAEADLALTRAALSEQRLPHVDILEARQAVRQSLDAQLDAQLRTLVRIDPATLARSASAAPIDTATKLRAFLDADGNQAAIKALHALDALPAAKAGKIKQVTMQAELVDQSLAAYRAVFGAAPGLSVGHVQTAIRCAVLETALAWPDGFDRFDPAEHRGTIEATLQTWGIDSSVARPEIDAILHQKFSTANLADWTKEAEQAFKAPAVAKPGLARRAFNAMRTRLSDNSPLDPGSRRAMIDSVRSMRVGDSMSLARGLTWNVSSSIYPIDVVGPLHAQVAIGVRGRNAMEVRRTEAGVEVVFKAGHQGTGALNFGASFLGGVRFNAGGEGQKESLSGAGIRFADAESAAMFVDAVLEGKKISPRIWAQAKETALVTDRALAAGITGRVMGAGGRQSPSIPGSARAEQLVLGGDHEGVKLGFLGGMQATLGAAREWRSVEHRNATGAIIEKTRTTTIEGSIELGAWLGLATMDTPFNGLALPVLYTLAGKRVITVSSSLAFERDGLLSARGNTVTRGVVATGRAGQVDLALIRPDQKEPDALSEATAAINAGPGKTMLDALIASATPGMSLSVTYALKDDIREMINDRLKGVESATRRGDAAQAKRQSEFARALYADESNYEVDTIQVSGKTAVEDSKTIATLIVADVSRRAEGTVTRPTMVLAIPGGPTARSMAAAATTEATVSTVMLPPSGIASGARRATTAMPLQASLDPSVAQPRRASAAASLPALSPFDLSLIQQVDASALPALDAVPHAQMYVEAQTSQACAIHSMNAFLGGKAVTIAGFDAWVAAKTAASGVKAASTFGLDSSATGFEPSWVAEGLALLQDSRPLRSKQWSIGMSRLTAPPAQASITQATLPDLRGIDRLIFHRESGLPAAPGAQVATSGHLVAFRRDDQGDWWLLDSLGGAGTQPGGGCPPEQISPQAWVDRLIGGSILTDLVMIGPGITTNTIRAVP